MQINLKFVILSLSGSTRNADFDYDYADFDYEKHFTFFK